MRKQAQGVAIPACIALLFISSCARKDTLVVRIAGASVKTVIADTDAERARGLMFKEDIGPSAGMLFIFEEEAPHAFWMKNMRFPLDLVWLDRQKRVVDIRTDCPPCTDTACESVVPGHPALYVLEVKAGFVARNRIAIGQRAEF